MNDDVHVPAMTLQASLLPQKMLSLASLVGKWLIKQLIKL